MLSKNNTNTMLSGLVKSSEIQKDYDSNPDNGKFNNKILHTKIFNLKNLTIKVQKKKKTKISFFFNETKNMKFFIYMKIQTNSKYLHKNKSFIRRRRKRNNRAKPSKQFSFKR